MSGRTWVMTWFWHFMVKAFQKNLGHAKFFSLSAKKVRATAPESEKKTRTCESAETMPGKRFFQFSVMVSADSHFPMFFGT